MAFSLHCKKTGKYITLNGDPTDYTQKELDDICYGPTTFGIKIGQTLELDLGDRKVSLRGLSKTQVDDVPIDVE